MGTSTSIVVISIQLTRIPIILVHLCTYVYTYITYTYLYTYRYTDQIPTWLQLRACKKVIIISNLAYRLWIDCLPRASQHMRIRKSHTSIMAMAKYVNSFSSLFASIDTDVGIVSSEYSE